MLQLSKEDATTFFSILFGGEHHIPGNLKEAGYGWTVCYRGDLATYDFSMLTRLVVLAHECCMRAYVMQGGPGSIKIGVNRRMREGSMSQRHPTLEDNINLIKGYRWPQELVDRLQAIITNKVDG
jgi:hypothetical protein